MSMVTGIFSVKCTQCSKQHDFTENDVDFDSVGGGERSMGPENLWVWKHEFECDECGNQIEIEYSVSEYPVGAFNFETINVEGATTVSEFGFDFQGGPDEDDHEDREEEDEDDTSTGSEPDKHGL